MGKKSADCSGEDVNDGRELVFFMTIFFKIESAEYIWPEEK